MSHVELRQAMQEFADYLEQLGRRESTRLAYRTDLGDFYEALRKHLQREPSTADLSEAFTREYLETQVERQRRSTLLRRIASLRSFERYLLEKGYIEQPFVPNKAYIQSLLQRAKEARPTPCISSEDLRKLWELFLQTNTRRAWRDLVLVALLVEWGFSTERLIHLELSDVDLENKRVRVRGPGGVETWFPIKYAVGPLTHYLGKVRQQYNMAANETRVFVSQLGRPLSRQSIWQSLGAWGRVAGFPYPLTPRVLRSTAAYRLWRLNVPKDLIQQALGHTNPISTQFLLRRLQQTCGDMPIPKIPYLDPETLQIVDEPEDA